MEVGTSETSHNKNRPGSKIDNFQTVITMTYNVKTRKKERKNVVTRLTLFSSTIAILQI